MPLYPLDFCKAVVRTARARVQSAQRFRAAHCELTGAGFTAAQYLKAAAQYRTRAAQTTVIREQREYEALARRFAEDAANAQAPVRPELLAKGFGC